MGKALITSVLVCGLSAALLAGCGGSSATTSSAAAPAAASTQSTTAPASATPPATTSTAASAAQTTSGGPVIHVTAALIAQAKVACTQVGANDGPFQATLAKACGELESGDLQQAITTYNSICKRVAAAGEATAVLIKDCPKLVGP